MITKRKRYESLARVPFDGELQDAAGKTDGRVVRPPILYLTHEDRLHIRIDIRKGSLVAFALQYEGLLEDEWRPIIRIDASQSELPHHHIFHPILPDRKGSVLKVSGSYWKVFHEGMKHLRMKYKDYKETYKNAI